MTPFIVIETFKCIFRRDIDANYSRHPRAKNHALLFQTPRDNDPSFPFPQTLVLLRTDWRPCYFRRFLRPAVSSLRSSTLLSPAKSFSLSFASFPFSAGRS